MAKVNKKLGMNKTKRKTIESMTKKELIKVLYREFSLFIRMSAADDNGFVCCPTCLRIYHWKDMDCSHYVNRHKMSVRWDERNVIAQCRSENRFQSGSIYKLRQVLVEKYGEEAIKQVEYLAGFNDSSDIFWLREKINEFRKKVKQLKNEKGV